MLIPFNKSRILFVLLPILSLMLLGCPAPEQVVVEREVVKEVPVEVVREVDVVREVPMEVVRRVPVEVPVEVPVKEIEQVEVVREVPVEVQVEVVATPTPAPVMGPKEPFVIGAMDAVTGIGESYGTVIVQAKQLATDEINAAGGVDGRPLKLIVEDSKCNGQDSITAYRKLTDVDGVKIILGTTCSGAMLGAAPLAEEDGVVMFSASATSPDIEDAGDYIFRTAINDALLGIDAGNTMWVDGVRNLATINESTDYAEGVQNTTVERFEQLGGVVVASEKYSSDVTDFRTQLTKLFAADPDGVLLAAQSEFTGGTIVKQARELGYNGPFYTEVVPTGTTALEISGEAATGLKAIIPSPDLETQRGKDFLANFRDRYGYVTLPWFIGSAYDDVHIAAECLSRTGNDQDADGFRDCLYDISWSGAIGDGYSFNEKGEVQGLANAVVEVLPLSERTPENNGYKVLGPAPTP
jgi:branched-chain amino acid transport system substrate-binding protein